MSSLKVVIWKSKTPNLARLSSLEDLFRGHDIAMVDYPNVIPNGEDIDTFRFNVSASLLSEEHGLLILSDQVNSDLLDMSSFSTWTNSILELSTPTVISLSGSSRLQGSRSFIPIDASSVELVPIVSPQWNAVLFNSSAIESIQTVSSSTSSSSTISSPLSPWMDTPLFRGDENSRRIDSLLQQRNISVYQTSLVIFHNELTGCDIITAAYTDGNETPASSPTGIQYYNPLNAILDLIGNGGYSPTGSEGNIPSNPENPIPPETTNPDTPIEDAPADNVYEPSTDQILYSYWFWLVIFILLIILLLIILFSYRKQF